MFITIFFSKGGEETKNTNSLIECSFFYQNKSTSLLTSLEYTEILCSLSEFKLSHLEL